MATDSIKKTIARNLKEIRHQKGLTSGDVAEILGVSQSKISFIEHQKGILAASDVAVLSRRLGVPIADFYRGIGGEQEISERARWLGQLIHYGALFLTKPRGAQRDIRPLEETLVEALAYLEDDRFRQGYCAAFILQASQVEINFDFILARIGANRFLVAKFSEQVALCDQIAEALQKRGEKSLSRSRRQFSKARDLLREFLGVVPVEHGFAELSLEAYTHFVRDCLHGFKGHRGISRKS